MAAGPVSRLGSFEPGDKTGLRLSPHLHLAHSNSPASIVFPFVPCSCSPMIAVAEAS